MTLNTYFTDTLKQMIHKPMGILPYHFITPSAITDLTLDRQNGGYGQQYDWDLYFIGVALARKRPDLMPFFKEALLNTIHFIAPSGHTPRVLSPYRFYDPYDQHKPFLAQGVLLAAETLDDSSWITPDVWAKLVAYMNYWEERRGFHGLTRWKSAMESGVDNNATTVNMEDLSAESVDASTYFYLENQAMASLARMLSQDTSRWELQMKHLKHSINAIFWHEERGSYYDVLNFSDANAEHILVDSWTNMVPLWAGLASQQQADRIVQDYLLNTDRFRSPHGLRSLSKEDPQYNTAKRFTIYLHAEKRRWTVSNWQGPVWIVANWILLEGMKQYGYHTEAKAIAADLRKTMERDLSDTGTLHENYDPDRGNGLWASNFGSWNLLMWE
ncbi:MAG: MGH1-like glycoside hydrolase domain-containing protein [Patescibacteria group bacterium]